MSTGWQECKILIWGKTYPELSSKYLETVCTGGTLEDGSFVRLYPIPFRYLSDDNIFSKYQWIKARIKKSSEDPRPESYKIEPESIQVIEKISSDKNEWLERSKYVFKDQKNVYNSFEDLFSAYKKDGVSIGFVKPKSIDKIYIENRPEEDQLNFEQKLVQNQEKNKQHRMFDIGTNEFKLLKFLDKRFKINWHCNNPNCEGHKMAILDWEVYELARKVGWKKSFQRLEQIINLNEYSCGFFLGNFRIHPNRFGIGGIWYPKKIVKKTELTLFDN